MKIYIYKFKFSGESKEGLNNKVLEKLRIQKKGVTVNQPILIFFNNISLWTKLLSSDNFVFTPFTCVQSHS